MDSATAHRAANAATASAASASTVRWDLPTTAGTPVVATRWRRINRRLLLSDGLPKSTDGTQDRPTSDLKNTQEPSPGQIPVAGDAPVLTSADSPVFGGAIALLAALIDGMKGLFRR